MQDEIFCIICGDLINDPVKLDCEHSSCFGCVNRMLIFDNLYSEEGEVRKQKKYKLLKQKKNQNSFLKAKYEKKKKFCVFFYAIKKKF